jgi:hypothetical protein
MDLKILPTFLITPIKLMDMDFYFTMCSFYVFETLGHWMNYVLKTKYPLNEWNVILIYYVMNFFKFQKL